MTHNHKLGDIVPVVGGEVLYYPPLLQENKHAVASLMRLNTTDGGTVDIVVVDERFFDLSPATQLAVYTHEMGHVFFNHLDAVLDQGRTEYRIKLQRNGGVDPFEIQADHYAARIIGQQTMINGLKELADVFAQYRIRTDELLRRIESLKNTDIWS